MNQILCFGKNGNGEEIIMKPIIKFFSVIIIIFALILIGEGAYNLFLNRGAIQQNVGMPTLITEQDGSSVKIAVEYKKGIDKIIYSWNDGAEATIQCTGKTKVEESIELPIGTNILNISVIDVDGKMTKYSKEEFTFNSDIDTNKPDIEIVKGNGTGTIKLAISDDKGLKSITYQWDGDDVMPTEITEGQTTFELEIAAKEGQRTLTVIATDTSDNEETFTKTVKGAKKPEVKVTKEDNYLIIKANDDDKISKLEYNFNGQTSTIEDINEAEYTHKVELTAGENYIIVTVYDVDGLTEQYKGKCTL